MDTMNSHKDEIILNKLEDSKYEVLENYWNKPKTKLDEWKLLFTGTILECESYIKLHEKQLI